MNSTPTTSPDLFEASGIKLRTGSEEVCTICPDLPHPVWTHCTRCHASWRRTSRTGHCMTCHRTFTSPTGFDRHLKRVGCGDPADVRTRTGRAIFGEPRPNAAGTLVWPLADTRPEQ